MNFKFNDVVYVDSMFGNDATGQPNNLNLKYLTINNAYLGIQQIQDRNSFTIALSPGMYVIDLPDYENIAIESNNGIDGITPMVLVPELDFEQEWNGVFISDVTLIFPQDPDKEFRNTINIVGASGIGESAQLLGLNLVDASNKCNQDPNKYALDFERHKQEGKERAMQVRELNKRITTDQISPELIKPLLTNKSQFESKVNAALDFAAFINFQTTAAAYIDSRLGDMVGVPPSINGELIVNVLVSTLKTVLFFGVDDDDGPSPFIGALDAIWAILENFSSLSPLLKEFEEEQLTNIIINGTNINYQPNPDSNQFFIEEINSITEKYSGMKKLVYEKLEVIPNPISIEIKTRVENAIRDAQAGVISKTSDPQLRAKLSIVDSSINAGTTNETITLYNNIDYIVDNNSLPGIQILDTEDPNDVFPIINSSEKEGASVNRGSTFLRYKCIKSDYTHRRLDGTFFKIDASNNDITIKIPDTGDDLLWKGRCIEYKRVDNSKNKVKIVNKRGLFDFKSNKILLVSKHGCNSHKHHKDKCRCGHKKNEHTCGCGHKKNKDKCGCGHKYKKTYKLPYVSILILEDGNALITS